MLDGWCDALSLSMIESKAFLYTHIGILSITRIRTRAIEFGSMAKYYALHKERKSNELSHCSDMLYNKQTKPNQTVPRVYEYMSCHNQCHTLQISYLSTRIKKEGTKSVYWLLIIQRHCHWFGFSSKSELCFDMYSGGDVEWRGMGWWDEVMMRMCKEFDFYEWMRPSTKDVNVHFHLWHP